MGMGGKGKVEAWAQVAMEKGTRMGLDGLACRRLWSKCLAALYQPLGSLLAGQSPRLGDLVLD
jgi:hypothetical protein